MNALIAFDKYKDALTAKEVCLVAQQALQTARPEWSVQIAPLADGGDGFCETLTLLAGGSFHSTAVTGPDGEETEARYGLVSVRRLTTAAQSLLALPDHCETLAIVELAQSSGLAKTPLGKRSPWTTTTYGMGETIRHAIEAGADAMLVGLGGSATHDLALGALQALDFRFRTADGGQLEEWPSPRTWAKISAIEAPPADHSIPIRIACDVDHTLVGPQGAAAVFGPQKGLASVDRDRLDSLTSRMAIMLCHACNSGIQLMNTPGAGAAGGAAFGLMAALGATPLPGASLVFAWTDLPAKLEKADVVLTGEGRFDASSLKGKGPGSLALRALSESKAVYVFAGSLGPLPSDFAQEVHLVEITPANTPLADALRDTARYLQTAIETRFAREPKAIP